MSTSFPVPPEPASSAGMDGLDNWEKRRVDERDRLGLDRRNGSRRREIGSSDVKVKERKRVEKSGADAFVSVP
jgi:hypothetical protein